MRVAMFQCMRNDFQKGGAEQRTNGVGNQHIDPLRSHGNAQRSRRANAQQAAGK